MSDEASARMNARPLSPRLSIYRLHPVTLASGAHRISGLVLVLFVPLYLWLLLGLTGSPEDFRHSADFLRSCLGRAFLWMVGMALIYHLLNGIRFLCIDAGWADGRETMRLGARVMLGLAAVSAVLLGVLLWP